MQSVLVGLLGKNILASKSPLLHESEAQALGLSLIYRLYDFTVSHASTDDLEQYLQAAELLDFSGFNITHPFKQAIIPFLDELSEEARTINAVNTVIFRNNKRSGFNTDYLGFRDAFQVELASAATDNVVLLGAGGAGCAVGAAMLNLGTRHLFIHDKNMSRAHELTNSLNQRYGAGKVSAIAETGPVLAKADGLINASPIGMAEFPGMPLKPDQLRPELWVADIIYFPIETQLLRHARLTGCRTMNGGRMAVYQAASAFELFTGLKADRERMLQTFNATVANNI